MTGRLFRDVSEEELFDPVHQIIRQQEQGRDRQRLGEAELCHQEAEEGKEVSGQSALIQGS